MIVDAKCNITTSALEVANELMWGLKSNTKQEKLLENYIEYLNCPIDYTICSPAPCSNVPTIVFSCSLTFVSITSSIDINGNLVLTANTTGGVAPLIYNWGWEDDDFSCPSGLVNNSSITLVPATGKQISLLVSRILLAVIDQQNCVINKTCWIDRGTMHCENGYTPPEGSDGLTVILL